MGMEMGMEMGMGIGVVGERKRLVGGRMDASVVVMSILRGWEIGELGFVFVGLFVRYEGMRE